MPGWPQRKRTSHEQSHQPAWPQPGPTLATLVLALPLVRDDADMPNYLDFLVAFDEHIVRSSLGFVIYGHELRGFAAQAGLTYPWRPVPGEMDGGARVVRLRLARTARPRRPAPSRACVSTPADLSRVSDYASPRPAGPRPTASGASAGNALTDGALGGFLGMPPLGPGALEPLRRPRCAQDSTLGGAARRAPTGRCLCRQGNRELGDLGAEQSGRRRWRSRTAAVGRRRAQHVGPGGARRPGNRV